MNKEFIPYEQALVLKELGYNLDSYSWWVAPVSTPSLLNNKGTKEPMLTFLNYTNHLSAPSYHQAFKFFREKYGLYSMVDVDQTMEPKFCYTLSKYKGDFQWDNILPTYSELYYTYEEAELECLKKLIEIAKQK